MIPWLRAPGHGAPRLGCRHAAAFITQQDKERTIRARISTGGANGHVRSGLDSTARTARHKRDCIHACSGHCVGDDVASPLRAEPGRAATGAPIATPDLGIQTKFTLLGTKKNEQPLTWRSSGRAALHRTDGPAPSHGSGNGVHDAPRHQAGTASLRIASNPNQRRGDGTIKILNPRIILRASAGKNDFTIFLGFVSIAVLIAVLPSRPDSRHLLPTQLPTDTSRGEGAGWKKKQRAEEPLTLRRRTQTPASWDF